MKAWITKNSVSGQDHKIVTGNLTIEDTDYINVGFYGNLNQVHISVDREMLLCIRDAINKELGDTE